MAVAEFFGASERSTSIGDLRKARAVTITIRQEPLPAIDEAFNLAVEHHAEIAEDKAELPFNPDYDHYSKLQQVGRLRCIIVRDDGHLVGYWALLIQEHPHSKGVKVAIGDMYFLAKNYRGQGIGHDMLDLAIDIARREGAKVFITREKLAHPHDAMFEEFGFRAYERAFAKPL
jgi:GNAT superfamily N-acetyltransferase